MASAKRRLGRGLQSLIASPVEVDVPGEPQSEIARPERRSSQPAPAGQTEVHPAAGRVRMIGVHEIRPNPSQPRRDFNEQALKSLADSIQADGLMQPVVVRSDRAGGFELVAGERRWRAAKMISLSTIPAVVAQLDDRTATQWSLIENIQREDLNPIERAEAFNSLVADYGLTHQEIAERVGLDRSSVSNHLRLLDLDAASTEAVRSGRLSMGHARALLVITNLEARTRLARTAMRQGWSVRELERRARRGSEGRGAGQGGSGARPAHLVDLERRLAEFLGTKVLIEPGRKKGSGRLVVSFFSLDEFEGLMRRLGFESEPAP